MIKVYGISNCDTVKKAINWLKQNKLDFEFHDYKKDGITKYKLKEWCAYFGWETILNKAGTTWKDLSEEEKNVVTNKQAAIKLMLGKTSIIRRPIIEADGKYLIRFNADEYKETLLFKN